jgi:hypothetical protein
MSDTPDDEPPPTPQEEAIGERLGTDRPLPTAGFRGALGRHLAVLDPGYGPRPQNMRWKALSFAAGGLLLLALGLLQATGSL